MYIETYKGIEVFIVKDIKGNNAGYQANKLTTKRIPVNFTPSLLMLKQFIRIELNIE